MIEIMQDALEGFNSRSTGKHKLDVVFFQAVVEKVIKINRSLRAVGGHTFLLAHEGSGSYELVKVATSMSDWEDCALYEKDSDLQDDWRMHLKDIMSKVY